jgi:hypothetical protein
MSKFRILNLFARWPATGTVKNAWRETPPLELLGGQ